MNPASSVLTKCCMNKRSEICIANIVSWIVAEAVYRNTNHIVTECIATP